MCSCAGPNQEDNNSPSLSISLLTPLVSLNVGRFRGPKMSSWEQGSYAAWHRKMCSLGGQNPRPGGGKWTCGSVWVWVWGLRFIVLKFEHLFSLSEEWVEPGRWWGWGDTSSPLRVSERKPQTHTERGMVGVEAVFLSTRVEAKQEKMISAYVFGHVGCWVTIRLRLPFHLPTWEWLDMLEIFSPWATASAS